MFVYRLQDRLGATSAVLHVGARRPDGPNPRMWELAGASHADTYRNTTGRFDLTRATPRELAAALAPATRVIGMDLLHLADSGPQHHYVAKAAVRRLDAWVREAVRRRTLPRRPPGRSFSPLSWRVCTARTVTCPPSRATDDAVARGFLLADDAPSIKALAAAAMELRAP